RVQIAIEPEIEIEPRIERQAKPAPPQLNRAATVRERGLPRPLLFPPNAEERQPAPLRERLPLAARAGPAVDFLVGIAEGSDPGGASKIFPGPTGEGGPRAIENIARIPGLARNPITEMKLRTTAGPPLGHSDLNVTISPLSRWKYTRSTQRSRPVKSG